MPTNILLPDTGSNSPVDVLEIHVKKGDVITDGQAIITVESDKATIEVPAPAGIVGEILVKIGDKIKAGDLILSLSQNQSEEKNPKQPQKEVNNEPPAPPVHAEPQKQSAAQEPVALIENDILAGPGVRRLARLLGADLSQISGTGERGRVTADDVRNFVKQLLTQGAAPSTGFALPTMPVIDFAQYGLIETVALSRIKQRTAQNLSRNWLLAPHVTQFDEADITDLELFRKKEAAPLAQKGLKLTLLAFIMKAVVRALQNFPQFNTSLDSSGQNLIYKKYFHIGIAVDTDEGLVVPVIRDVDQKTLIDLAKELTEISAKAREKKLTPQEMQGSSFTISSLGGIGGTAFTPIINLPNVAILGVSKASIKPQYDGEKFQPRLILPLSLSYDHRVIDGAEAAKFSTALSQYLSDIRKVLL
jgi:pyruvate dehydrogenase E2 component (dihydrolipoamide acetyltransferase)